MKFNSVGNLIQLFILLRLFKDTRTCIKLLNSQWRPIPLEERTKHAEVVLTAKIISTSPLPIIDSLYLYAATFEVITVLKGWEILKTLYYEKSSKSIIRLYPNIIASAIGFGDSSLCWSSVEVGESYALFLGYKRSTSELVAKYDDLFGAAQLLYKRTERDILKSLGWEEWSSWSPCSKSCSRGTQQRVRKCQKSTEQPCHGPKEQMKDCNLYSCKNSTDVLSFIRNYEQFPAWRTNAISNRILQERRVEAAPTYMLFDDEFPRDSVLHMSFKGPVTDSQFLFSVYSVNEKLEFGIMLSPFTLEFKYNKRVDGAVHIPMTKRFSYTFTKSKWFNVGILLKNEEVHIKLDCEETIASVLEVQLFKEFDIYGNMYLGADQSYGKERNVKVKIGQITLVRDPRSFEKQCGRITLEPPTNNKQKDEGSGDRSEDDVDDSESGDVDDASGSGMALVCSCMNGGFCRRDNTCICRHGWSGNDCEKPLCYKKCLAGGTCTKPNVCNCPKGTKGRYCQFKDCPIECKNGGRCGNDGKCKCTNTFHGDHCQHAKKCKNVRKQVPVTRPTVIYTLVDVWTPCSDNRTDKCLTKRRKYMVENQVVYRTELICET